MNNSKTLFISDLHLEENQPQITEQFLRLLTNCDQTVDALYILGDLFESWIGDDDNTPFNQQMMQALKQATTRGTRIYFMGGNRDFLIGKRFARQTGCQLLGDEELISVYGTSVLLMHGDTLCTRDVAYLKARKLGHHFFIQQLFLWLPLSTRKNFAQKMREKSQRHTSTTAAEIMDVTQEEVVRVMQKHRTNILIHGHTHRLGTHEFSLGNASGTRIVLDAWHQRGNVLVWDASGKREFIFLA